MQKGVKCPRGYIKHDDCRRCSANPLRPCHLTPDLLEMLREKDDYHADPDAFSPTGLLDCDRKSVLVSGGDWYVDIEAAYPMLRGNLVHGMVEQDAERYPGAVGVIRETVMKVEVLTSYGPQRFVGKPDAVVVLSVGDAEPGDEGVAHVKIVDYKSTSTIKHDLTSAKTDHQRQINMYAYLVKRWLEERTYVREVFVDELEIEYMDFSKTRRFTSAGPLSARGKRVSMKPLTYETLTLAPIQRFSLGVVEKAIVRMIEQRIAARTELPRAYDLDDPNYWRCLSCPVRERCEELDRKGV